MSHPNDGDRFTTPQPQEGAWNDQPHSQPEAPQYEVPQHEAPQHESSPYERSPYEAPQASAPGQQDSSVVRGPALMAGGGACPAPQGGGSGAGAQKSGEANFFKAMVDFKLYHRITSNLSTTPDILAPALAVLLRLAQILLGILSGVAIGATDSFYREPSFNP